MNALDAEEIARAVAEQVARDERVLAAYLLGSVVRGEMRDDSDVDVAILPMEGQTLAAMDRCELAAALSFRIGRDVDVGGLTGMNLIYAREAICGGRRVFARDRGAADREAGRLMGLYSEFAVDRQEVLNAYTGG